MKKKAMLFVAALLMTPIAFAATPENGWWWNPAEPGTGYNIESQNGTMFMATFVYDEAGNPVWYSGSGQINRNNTVTINLLRSNGGQCLGCAHTTSQSSDSGYQITLSFSDDSHGIVHLNGVETPIERFNFNLGGDVEKLLGMWMMNIVAPIINGLGVSDTTTYTRLEDGMVFGARVFNGAHTSGAATIDDAGKVYASITPISGTEKMVAVFGFSGLNSVLGMAAIVGINANVQETIQKIQNSGVLFVGFRAASTADIQNASPKSSTSPSEDIAQIQHEVNEISASIDEETIAEIMLAAKMR